MSDSKFAVECSPENAPKFRTWLESRGGIAVWQSVNLSNPGASWSTPALQEDGTPYGKPTWEAGNTPRIVEDAAAVGIITEELFKAFPVALRRGSGFSFHISDAAQRKLNKVMAQCEEKHGSASYRKGVLDIDGASIGVYYTIGIVPLNEWVQS